MLSGLVGLRVTKLTLTLVPFLLLYGPVRPVSYLKLTGMKHILGPWIWVKGCNLGSFYSVTFTEILIKYHVITEGGVVGQTWWLLWSQGGGWGINNFKKNDHMIFAWSHTRHTGRLQISRMWSPTARNWMESQIKDDHVCLQYQTHIKQIEGLNLYFYCEKHIIFHKN